jgi:hypothetical protein
MADTRIITGGTEHAYLDQETRSQLWDWADKLGISRNELTKTAIKFYLEWLENTKGGEVR